MQIDILVLNVHSSMSWACPFCGNSIYFLENPREQKIGPGCLSVPFRPEHSPHVWRPSVTTAKLKGHCVRWALAWALETRVLTQVHVWLRLRVTLCLGFNYLYDLTYLHNTLATFVFLIYHLCCCQLFFSVSQLSFCTLFWKGIFYHCK